MEAKTFPALTISRSDKGFFFMFRSLTPNYFAAQYMPPSSQQNLFRDKSARSAPHKTHAAGYKLRKMD